MFRCSTDVLTQNSSVLYGYFGRILLDVVRIISTTNFVALRIFWHDISRSCQDALAQNSSVLYGHFCKIRLCAIWVLIRYALALCGYFDALLLGAV